MAATISPDEQVMPYGCGELGDNPGVECSRLIVVAFDELTGSDGELVPLRQWIGPVE